MTKLVLLPVILLLMLGANFIFNGRSSGITAPPAGALRVATHNVHYILVGRQSGRWSEATWMERRAPLDATFRALQADLVAFQEMESFAGGNSDDNNLARTWLLENNPDYAAAAVGDWRVFPSTQPVLYRTERLEALDQGWFFFSETPDVIYSRTFNGSFPAFASWVDFRDRSNGQTVRVINVHLDFSSRDNRRRSVDLIAERVGRWIGEGRKVILLGDLNALRISALHRTLRETGLEFLPVRGSTVHFDRGLNVFGAIDHVAISSGINAVGRPMVFREKLGEMWPSDHYPVVADVDLSD